MNAQIYNCSMRRLKIFITIFVLYELVMLTILQISDYCLWWFNYNFCETGVFKYFLMCIMLPLCFTLFIWWIPEISRMLCKNKCECMAEKEPSSIKDILREIVSTKDIERLITAAIIMGVQKFVNNHPKTKATLTDILKNIEK